MLAPKPGTELAVSQLIRWSIEGRLAA